MKKILLYDKIGQGSFGKVSQIKEKECKWVHKN